MIEIKTNVKGMAAGPLQAQPDKPEPIGALFKPVTEFLSTILAEITGTMKFANRLKKGDGKKITIGGAGHLLDCTCKNRSASTRYLQLFDSPAPAEGDKPDREWTITTLQTFDAVWPHGRPFNSGMALVLSSVEGTLTTVTAADALLEATFRT